MPKFENSHETFWVNCQTIFVLNLDFWHSVIWRSTWGYEEVQVFSPSPKWMNNGDCKLEMHFVAESFWAGDLASSCGQSVVKFKSWKTEFSQAWLFCPMDNRGCANCIQGMNRQMNELTINKCSRKRSWKERRKSDCER